MFFFRTILPPGILWSNKAQCPITTTVSTPTSPKHMALWTPARSTRNGSEQWMNISSQRVGLVLVVLPSEHLQYGRQSSTPVISRMWRLPWWTSLYWVLSVTLLPCHHHCHAPIFLLAFSLSWYLSVFSIQTKANKQKLNKTEALNRENGNKAHVSCSPC